MVGQLLELPLRGSSGNQSGEALAWNEIAVRGDMARDGPLARYAIREYGPDFVEWLRSQAYSGRSRHPFRRALVGLRRRASAMFGNTKSTSKETHTRPASRDAHSSRIGTKPTRGKDDPVEAYQAGGSGCEVTEFMCSCEGG